LQYLTLSFVFNKML